MQNTEIIRREIPYQDPLGVFGQFAGTSLAQIFHSCPGAAGGGRFSFIMIDPFDYLVAQGTNCRTRHQRFQGNPFDRLQEDLRRLAFAGTSSFDLPFTGGAAGLFGYELLNHLEKITPIVASDLGTPDMCIGYYDTVVVFDHKNESAWVVSTGLPERNPIARVARARQRADEIVAKVSDRTEAAMPPRTVFAPPKSNLDPDDYKKMVARAIEYIYAGDIYQANLSQRFEAHADAGFSPYDIFRRILDISPVSFAAYCRFSDFAIASNSPERFIKVAPRNGERRVETKPIKGTLPRHTSPEIDEENRRKLRSSAKDRAENTMIVDLLRNDLSKVCNRDSIVVEKLCDVESYTAVHHLVSTISGTLHPDTEIVDVLKACFPGGSVTGAPKVRAMEIITELEGKARGPYCGSVGYIGFDGAMDSNIAIRTMLAPLEGDGTAKKLYYQVGGGIVADSDPQLEYEESLAKAKAFFEIVGR